MATALLRTSIFVQDHFFMTPFKSSVLQA